MASPSARSCPEKTRRECVHLVPAGGEVTAPLPSPVGPVEAREERRDHLAELGVDELGVGADLRQGVAPHPQQQVLVGLAGAVHADVRERRRREQAPQGVECPGPHRLAVGEVGDGAVVRVRPRQVRLHERQELGVGVEHPVHVADVAGAESRVEHLGVPPVAVVTGRKAGVERDEARRLLEVAHQAPPLEDLGKHVGGLLAGEVDAAELGDRVVAELDEDPLVELLGPPQPHGRVDRGVPRDVEVAEELVEEEAPHALGRPRVAGEERPADDLRQVDEGVDRPVEVRHVVAQHLALVGGEGLDCVVRHLDETTRRCPAGRGSCWLPPLPRQLAPAASRRRRSPARAGRRRGRRPIQAASQPR